LAIFNRQGSYLPSKIQFLFEAIYNFVLTIVSEQCGKSGIKYFPHFFTIFLTILTFNLVGILPFLFTVTSQIAITMFLGLSYFLAWIIIGVSKLKFKFLYIFFPRNMPIWLLPLLVIVEILSFSLRPLSLSIRLFANMLAGHILLHILAGAALITLFSVPFGIFLPVGIVVAAVFLLEVGICVLQAYIYTVLLAIYLRDSLILHG